jgi:hypothetical protein
VFRDVDYFGSPGRGLVPIGDARFGKPDILVNDAGTSLFAATEEASDEQSAPSRSPLAVPSAGRSWPACLFSCKNVSGAGCKRAGMPVRFGVGLWLRPFLYRKPPNAGIHSPNNFGKDNVNGG